MACERCDPWQRRRGASSWTTFEQLAVRVLADVEAGVLTVLRSNLPLDPVPAQRPAPADGFDDVQVWLACTSCRQQFLLFFKAEPPVGGWQPQERPRV
ncbi:MAG: hypothetical protein ACTHOD_07090 [Motilibacteraceae bacterium]